MPSAHVDRVDALPLVQHAEREHGEHLGLTAGEEAGSVSARQVVHHAADRTDLLDRAAVGALALVEDHVAHGLLLERLEEALDVLGVGALSSASSKHALELVLDGRHRVHAGVLVGVVERGAHLVGTRGEDPLAELCGGLVELHDHRRDLELGQEALLHGAELADGLLREGERREHVLLGHLVGARLDHVDRVAATGHHEVEIGCLGLLEGRVHEELAEVVAADAHAGERALEREAGGHQRSRRAHDGDDVDLVLLVGREDRGDDLDVVAEVARERRTDRTVDHACRERGLLARARLTLDEAAGQTPRGVHALFEVDREREEVEILRLLARGRGDQHHAVALSYQDGAAGLLGQLAGLERVLLVVQLEAFGYLSHPLPLLRPPAPCGAASSCGASCPYVSEGGVIPAFTWFRSLVAETELRDDRAVALDVVLLEVVRAACRRWPTSLRSPRRQWWSCASGCGGAR